jgi:hypothetical protein
MLLKEDAEPNFPQDPNVDAYNRCMEDPEWVEFFWKKYVTFVLGEFI